MLSIFFTINLKQTDTFLPLCNRVGDYRAKVTAPGTGFAVGLHSREVDGQKPPQNRLHKDRKAVLCDRP